MKVVLKAKFKKRTEQYTLIHNQSAIIGRSRNVNLSIPDLEISGAHCRFNLKNDGLEIVDLESKNGTYLNGIRVEKADIFAGDEIRIGETTITLDEKEFDEDAVKYLTFSGPMGARLDAVLKMDFTGARVENQKISKDKKPLPLTIKAHQTEVILRRRFSAITLTKQEIKEMNKDAASVALLIDIILGLIVCLTPVYLWRTGLFSNFSENGNLYLVGFIEVFGAGTFLLLNFQVWKFSIGERLAGIAKLYHKQ
jgi:hypothetical protein